MTDNEPFESPMDARQQSEAMERLRDRTDELELIISSLTIFALFSAPSWFWSLLGDTYAHMSTSLAIGSSALITVLTGLCYGLAVCFVVHLMVRAYWVGLIGLKSAFPEGIRWDRIPTIGPLTRNAYQRSLPDLQSMIVGTDRLASSLFAVISVLTLVMLWLGTVWVFTLVGAGAIGSQFSVTNTALIFASLALLLIFAGVPVLIYLLDAQLAARIPALRRSGVFVFVVAALRLLTNFAYPRRLLLPVQLTLQSNTRPFVFYLVLAVTVFTMVSAGQWRVNAWREFTISDQFTYLDTQDVESGFRTAYYEDMHSSKDRIRTWPRLTSFVQSRSAMRLFLPYHPLRDNLALAQICGPAEDVEDPARCLAKLWSVTLDGDVVSLDGFVAAERSDIGMRGLMGIVALGGLEPGMHQLEVIWGGGLSDGATNLDDRYEEDQFVYNIPFAFSPEFERALPE